MNLKVTVLLVIFGTTSVLGGPLKSGSKLSDGSFRIPLSDDPQISKMMESAGFMKLLAVRTADQPIQAKSEVEIPEPKEVIDPKASKISQIVAPLKVKVPFDPKVATTPSDKQTASDKVSSPKEQGKAPRANPEPIKLDQEYLNLIRDPELRSRVEAPDFATTGPNNKLKVQAPRGDMVYDMLNMPKLLVQRIERQHTFLRVIKTR